MKTNKAIILIAVLTASGLTIGGVYLANKAPVKDEAPTQDGSKPTEEKIEFSGTILAGSSSKLYDYKKSDLDKAKQTDLLIVLYFYANWCPICREELPHLYGAFNELSTDRVIGFRVNYNDSDTDDDERNLAREHGITYQHSKVFIKKGQRVLKSPESWQKSRYLSEFNKHAQ